MFAFLLCCFSSNDLFISVVFVFIFGYSSDNCKDKVKFSDNTTLLTIQAGEYSFFASFKKYELDCNKYTREANESYIWCIWT